MDAGTLFGIIQVSAWGLVFVLFVLILEYIKGEF
jgi:hypothetical protein